MILRITQKCIVNVFYIILLGTVQIGSKKAPDFFSVFFYPYHIIVIPDSEILE